MFKLVGICMAISEEKRTIAVPVMSPSMPVYHPMLPPLMNPTIIRKQNELDDSYLEDLDDNEVSDPEVEEIEADEDEDEDPSELTNFYAKKFIQYPGHYRHHNHHHHHHRRHHRHHRHYYHYPRRWHHHHRHHYHHRPAYKVYKRYYSEL